MEHGYLRGVSEVGWDALAPRVMRPAKEDFARVVEKTLALTEFEAKLVAQRVDEPREARIERQKRRYSDITDPEALQRASREKTKRRELRLAGATPPAETWSELVPADAVTSLERSFAGAVAPKGAAVSPHALHVAWGAWNVDRRPATVAPVLALAADVEGMRAAEELAAEACRRLGSPVRRVTWFIEHEPRLVDFRDAHRFRARIDERLAIPHDRLTAGEVVTDTPRNPSEDAWRFEWLRLAKRDLVRANVWPDETGPFDPILHIWRRGYAVVDVIGDAVVLAAPCPDLVDLLDALV